jgi:preprotein translocase subunit SecB
MNPSPLQLERHFFTKVVVDTNPAGKVEVANEVNCQVEVGQAAEDPKRFEVVVRVKLLSPPKGEACYTGEIHAVGLFRVLDGWPADKTLWLVESNGSALLYGAIRELFCNLTSRGPWPQVVLKSVTFVQPKMKPQPAGGREMQPVTPKG